MLVTSGTVHWCNTCGCLAESRTAKRMQMVCPGPPPVAAGNGGVRQQLMGLRAGMHPVTGIRLPATRGANGSTASRNWTYSRLKPSEGDRGSFAPYELRDVIRSFVGDASDTDPVEKVGEVDSDEEFWLNLPLLDTRGSRIQSVPTLPTRTFPG